MTAGSILIGISILVLTALFVARPFLIATRNQPIPFQNARHQLQAQKEALLVQIHQLDFDYETGKIPPEVYQPQRTQLVNAAANILRQLDQLTETNKDLVAQIEAAIAQIRQSRPKPTAVSTRTLAYCPQCGQPVETGDKFCAACGHKLHSN